MTPLAISPSSTTAPTSAGPTQSWSWDPKIP